MPNKVIAINIDLLLRIAIDKNHWLVQYIIKLNKKDDYVVVVYGREEDEEHEQYQGIFKVFEAEIAKGNFIICIKGLQSPEIANMKERLRRLVGDEFLSDCECFCCDSGSPDLVNDFTEKNTHFRVLIELVDFIQDLLKKAKKEEKKGREGGSNSDEEEEEEESDDDDNNGDNNDNGKSGTKTIALMVLVILGLCGITGGLLYHFYPEMALLKIGLLVGGVGLVIGIIFIGIYYWFSKKTSPTSVDAVDDQLQANASNEDENIEEKVPKKADLLAAFEKAWESLLTVDPNMLKLDAKYKQIFLNSLEAMYDFLLVMKQYDQIKQQVEAIQEAQNTRNAIAHRWRSTCFACGFSEIPMSNSAWQSIQETTLDLSGKEKIARRVFGITKWDLSTPRVMVIEGIYGCVIPLVENPHIFLGITEKQLKNVNDSHSFDAFVKKAKEGENSGIGYTNIHSERESGEEKRKREITGEGMEFTNN